jgi:hypothetical protein
MFRTWLVAGGVLLLAPVTAHAQLPPHKPPPLTPYGAKLKWPTRSPQRAFEAGQTIEVTIDSPRRRAKLSLVAVDDKGTPTRAVARRTLRRGTFRASIPGSGTYALRLVIGDRRYWTWINAMACLNLRGDQAEIRLHAPSVPAGGYLSYDLVNTSAGCIGAGEGYLIEQLLADGTWGPTPPRAFSLPLTVLESGQAKTKTAIIDVPPGTYRFVDSVLHRILAQPPQPFVQRDVSVFSAPFTVVAST